MKAFEEIASTLSSADNESTASPYWLIIDPSPITAGMSGEDDDGRPYEAELNDEFLKWVASMIPHCITGPYFSREAANAHLAARRYAFSDATYVYCCSGYYSNQYRRACEQVRP